MLGLFTRRVLLMRSSSAHLNLTRPIVTNAMKSDQSIASPLVRPFYRDADSLLPQSSGGDFPVGNAWSIGLLRGKSWDDLHALWFILQRERNMLLTEKYTVQQLEKLENNIESSCIRTGPIRIEKVNKSIRNIKEVIRERYTEWHAAQKLFSLKLQGVDIRNPQIMRMITDMRHEREWLLTRKTRKRNLTIEEKERVVELYKGTRVKYECKTDMTPSTPLAHYTHLKKEKVRRAQN